MNNYWILAVAESNTPAQNVVKAEDINAKEQPATTTQTTADSNGTGAKLPPPKQPAYQTFIFLGLMVVLLYFVMFRGPKKRQQQQDQMVKSLKKNDRVQTIGGILGTILDVSDTEVTLKIDESNNTKIKVVPSAVNKVLNS
jgi:preprotein translocase subunit YajC